MRMVFWNVDTQHDFMREDGKLYVPGAEQIEPRLAQLTELAEKYRIKVVNTADKHRPGSAEIAAEPDFAETFPEHCMEGTAGVLYIAATAPVDAYAIDWTDKEYDRQQALDNRNIILYKDAFDVFAGNPHTQSIVELLQPEAVVVYGVATNVCVAYAVNGLLDRGVKVYVPQDAIKGLPSLPLEETIREWERKGAELIHTEAIEEYLRE